MMLVSVCPHGPHTIDLDRFGGFGWFQHVPACSSCQARTALLAESGVLLQKLNNVGAQGAQKGPGGPGGPGFQQLDGR